MIPAEEAERPVPSLLALAGAVAAYFGAFFLVSLLFAGQEAIPEPLAPLLCAAGANLAAFWALWNVPGRVAIAGSSRLPPFLAALVTFPLASAVNLGLHGVEEPAPVERMLASLEGFTPIAVGALVAVILAPLAEEAFFRGALYPAIRARAGPAGSVLIVTALFTLAHEGSFSLAVLAAVSAVWAVLAEVTGGLAAPLASHMVLNGLAFALAVDGWALMKRLDWPLVAGLTSGALLLYGAAGWFARSRGWRPALARLYWLGAATLVAVLAASLAAQS